MSRKTDEERIFALLRRLGTKKASEWSGLPASRISAVIYGKTPMTPEMIALFLLLKAHPELKTTRTPGFCGSCAHYVSRGTCNLDGDPVTEECGCNLYQ